MKNSDFLLNVMRIWAWPIFAFSVLFLYRRAIGELISRLHTVTSKMGNVTFTELKEIQQDLPSSELKTDPKVKDIHQSLNLSTRAVETVIPAPLSDCREDVSDETLPLIMESSWQHLIGVLKQQIAHEVKDKPKTLPDLLKALKSSRRLPSHIVKSVTRLANLRQHLLTGTHPIDAETVTAFVETVEKIIFTLQDREE